MESSQLDSLQPEGQENVLIDDKKMAQVYTKIRFSALSTAPITILASAVMHLLPVGRLCPSQDLQPFRLTWGYWLPLRWADFLPPGHCFCGPFCETFFPWVSTSLNSHIALPTGSLSWSPSGKRSLFPELPLHFCSTWPFLFSIIVIWFTGHRVYIVLCVEGAQ